MIFFCKFVTHTMINLFRSLVSYRMQVQTTCQRVHSGCTDPIVVSYIAQRRPVRQVCMIDESHYASRTECGP